MIDKADMIEPTDPYERLLAIRICRANAYLRPEDGVPESDVEHARMVWEELPDLPYVKWIWMWNHGRAEWDPRYAKLLN